MHFSLARSIEILERTPETLSTMLGALPDDWTTVNEGGDTWSAFDVVGHLIHCDEADWMTRAELILSDSDNKLFEPLDRFAQFNKSKGKTLTQLLARFREVRSENIQKIRDLDISSEQLSLTGKHPVFGEVTLSQLIAAWTVHDLDHVCQITRVMAKQYREEVGPWFEFLKVLKT